MIISGVFLKSIAFSNKQTNCLAPSNDYNDDCFQHSFLQNNPLEKCEKIIVWFVSNDLFTQPNVAKSLI